MPFIETNANYGDAVTGERIFPGEKAFDTGLRNKSTTWLSRGKTRLVKEETIVWLAEQAGYDVVKRDAGDSGDTKVVDRTDDHARGGEAKAGKAKAGGKPTIGEHSDGPVKSQ